MLFLIVLLSVLLPLFIKDEISPTSNACAGDTPASSSPRARRCFFITIPSVKQGEIPLLVHQKDQLVQVASNCTLTSPLQIPSGRVL